MKIRPACIEVPGMCRAKCKFCDFTYGGMTNIKDYTTSPRAWEKIHDRLEFLRDSKINTILITGVRSEPIENESFLRKFKDTNDNLRSPFKNIEIQATCHSLNEGKLKLMSEIGVKTVAISVSSLDSDTHTKITGIQESIDQTDTCHLIKRAGFNLRLVLNINYEGFSQYTFDDNMWNLKSVTKKFDHLIRTAKKFDPDQVTFRRLRPRNDKKTLVNDWIRNNDLKDDWWVKLKAYMVKHSHCNYKLFDGIRIHSVNDMSVVVDDDFQRKHGTKIQYAIIRKDCRVYSRWDDPASLIF